MIARQGEKKQWHFAHASRSVYKQTDHECEYSFFVSVRLMARQVVGNSLNMKLPTYEEKASLFVEAIGSFITQRYVITKEKRVTIEKIEIEKEFYGAVIDVYGEIDGYPIVLYFTHPGRALPVELESLEGIKCGIVEVSLRDTYSLFTGDGSAEQSYLDKLRIFLAEDGPSKRWVFHPRSRHVREQAEQALEARRETLAQRSYEAWKQTSRGESIADTEPAEEVRSEDNRLKVKYQCVMCGTTWIGIEPGYSSCPKCKTHLYGRRLGYLDNET